ncbi:MAG: preprotein translocase subunit SecE [Lachnospiraceae bacterium]|nr:preprotein translocase subunit SecE [Lachnospiraceae bacterium]
MGETNSSHKQSKLVAFFDGVKSEFKKIIWPEKMELVKQTVTVSVVSIVLGLLIALIDTIVQYGINFLTM